MHLVPRAGPYQLPRTDCRWSLSCVCVFARMLVWPYVLVCVCVRALVRVRARACACVCVRACVRVPVRACV